MNIDVVLVKPFFEVNNQFVYKAQSDMPVMVLPENLNLLIIPVTYTFLIFVFRFLKKNS